MLLLALLSACREPVEPGSPDADGDGWNARQDCDDGNPDVHPGATEACNLVDDDCDGEADEDWDRDRDGVSSCPGPDSDCNDQDADVYPGAAEVCDDGIDNDCSGVVDDTPDDDGDGFDACSDCDDTDATVFPGAPDRCDGVDGDCDGSIDEDFDADGDGVSTCAGDCDDEDPDRAPNHPEECDEQDNDCDDAIDEGFDADGDGQSSCRGDCDDTDATRFYGNVEQCGDGIDNDCDDLTNETEDLDGDGYTYCTGDCDDADDTVNPAGVETCDSKDNDCSGVADDVHECYSCTTMAQATGTYEYCTNYVSWTTARDLCASFGEQLVILDSSEKNAEVSEEAYYYHFGDASWIGLTDEDSEGTFTWVDGSPLVFSAWYSGEPNDSGGEDRAATNFGAVDQWNDYGDSSTLPFVCEVL